MSEQYFKYPRTFHLPYSETLTSDDKRLESDDHFKLMTEVVVSEKMDGQNQTVYSDGYFHARSIDGHGKSWDNWFKQFVKKFYYDIPKGWRICGECLYAKHSIGYKFPNDGYMFQVFGIYDEFNNCLSYEQTWMWCDLLGLKMVPTIYIGKYNKDKILNLFNDYKSRQRNDVEGFVIRNIDAFKYDDFANNVGKYVRKNHVQNDEHWTKNWVPNKVDFWKNIKLQ